MYLSGTAQLNKLFLDEQIQLSAMDDAIENMKALVKSNAKQLLPSLCNTQHSFRFLETRSFFRTALSFMKKLENSDSRFSILYSEVGERLEEAYEAASVEYVTAIEHTLMWDQWRQVEVPAFIQFMISKVQKSK